MEKTIKYLLQEAYVDGYKDAREAVAKEIQLNIWAINGATAFEIAQNTINECIEIAKGNK